MKYLTNSGLSYFLNKIKAYLTSSTYLNSIGISNSDIDDIADDAGYSSGSLPASEDVFLTGDIIPNTDNSVDLGASSKNIKMVYTKGITINGTQFLPSDYATLSGLATVATSGSYNDLSNKPTIPTVNNATLTIQKNGANVQTFTANQSTNATANITVPTKTSDLTNDSGFITEDTTKIPLAGSNQISGSLIPATTDAYDLGSPSVQWNNAYIKSLTINGVACGDILMHNASEFVPRSGGAVITGNLAKVNDTSLLTIIGAPAENMGALINLYGKNQGTDLQGAYLLQAYDDINRKYRYFVGYPNGTLTWFGQPIQYTSDQRLKQQITQIDDKLLDAWEDVNLVQFKYNDAVGQKKDKARLHTGYVVQQIDTACKSHNVDISEYGLYCHEEYPEETEEVEVEKEDGTIKKETKVIREASEHYSLRYTEVYAIECAYLRKQIKELKERLEKLEGNSK